MKTIGRMVVILFAAAVVIGATWLIGQNNGNSTFVPRERPTFAGAEAQAAPATGELRANREFRERGERHTAQWLSMRGWLGFTQTLVPMTIIIVLVALPTKYWKRRQRARRSQTSALPA